MFAWLLGLAFAAPVHDVSPPLDARFSAGNSEAVSPIAWWESFEDPGLNGLMVALLDHNPSLHAADARVARAFALSRQSASVLWPRLFANGSATLTPASVQWFNFGGNPPLPPPTPNAAVADPALALRGTIDASWQIDVFGANILAWKANRFAALAAEGDRDAQLLIVTLRAATLWFDHALATERLRSIEAQIRRSEDLVEVLESRLGSDATGLDVLQQRQQLAATSLLRPAAEAARDASRLALAVLLAEAPETWSAPVTSLPSIDKAPAIGTPAELVSRRPDLKRAVAGAASARRARLSAQRSGLPRLTANLQWGRQSSTFFEDHPQDGPLLSYGAGVSVPLFEGLRSRSTVAALSHEERAANATLEQAIRQAIADVERALVNERRAEQVRELAEIQRDAATLAFEEARRQYVEGTTPYLTVQSTLAAQQAAELTQLDALHAQAIARLALFEAIGAPTPHSAASP